MQDLLSVPRCTAAPMPLAALTLSRNMVKAGSCEIQARAVVVV